MLNIHSLVLGALDTNCYIIWDDSSLEALVIDPADSGDTVSEFILSKNLSLSTIVLTHGHFDHVLGLLELYLNFKPLVLMNDADLFLLKDTQKSAEHWLKMKVDPVPAVTRHIGESEAVEVGNYSFQVIETPGHTPGSISLYTEAEGVLFSGDTLFAEGVGRTDFSYSNTLQLRDSLDKLITLPDDTVLYSGHGAVSSVGEAKKFLGLS